MTNDVLVEQTILDETNAQLPPNIDTTENNPNSISTSPHEVEFILKYLQLGKASGPDETSNHILKKTSYPMSLSFSNLFNFSLATAKVPLAWKEANVTPIFKINDPSVVSNYRPISLLSAVGKVLEKVVHKHLFNYIRDHEILSALQSGFIPGDSTINQLVGIYNTF